jgi:hypothetical protein
MEEARMMMTRTSGFIIGCILFLGGSSSAKAQALEIETHLNQGVVVGGSAYGYSTGLGGGIRLGLMLGERVGLMFGLDAGGSHSEGYSGNNSSVVVSVPLELKVYLRQVRAKRFVPLIRLGGGYSHSSYESETMAYAYHSFSALGAVGVQYFFTDEIGLGFDAGLAYGRSFSGSNNDFTSDMDEDGWSLVGAWRMGLVFRI